MSTPPMLRQMRHDVWATIKLLTYLRGLSDAQLDLSVPGTYGNVRRTLEHIVAADTRYLARIGFVVLDTPYREDHDVSLDEIAAMLEKVKAGVERVFTAEGFDPDRVVVDDRRRVPTDPQLEMETWMMLTQFVHHGSDHRAHIGTILGANGLDVPDLDVWTYGREIGAIREAKAP